MCPVECDNAIPILGAVALGSSNTTTTLSPFAATLAADGVLPKTTGPACATPGGES